jgi:hypothetical protein
MHRKWRTKNQYMVKSTENLMRSNLDLFPVMNVTKWLKIAVCSSPLNIYHRNDYRRKNQTGYRYKDFVLYYPKIHFNYQILNYLSIRMLMFAKFWSFWYNMIIGVTYFGTKSNNFVWNNINSDICTRRLNLIENIISDRRRKKWNSV